MKRSVTIHVRAGLDWTRLIESCLFPVCHPRIQRA